MRKKSTFIRLLTVVTCLFATATLYAQGKVGDVFPSWQEGHLDIHHINTGKGDAAFFIFPDGTTMLVDAGQHTRPPGPRELSIIPDESRSPGEWISRYILHMMEGHSEKRINYALLTHFDGDHMGSIHAGAEDSENGDYKLVGITDVGDRIPLDKVIDRAWPDYNWPVPLEQSHVANYRKFLSWQSQHKGLKAERFVPGRNDQIVLLKNPSRYENFEVRNIVANGVVWTGVGTNTQNHFPLVENLERSHYPSENMSSLGIRVSYGAFDYFTGGDLVGIPPAGSPEWMDIETPVGKAVGPVDVHVLNHHGYYDAGNENFIKALRPRVHIIQSWVVAHPTPATLSRMLSTRLYSGPRDVFATNITEVGRTFIGGAFNNIKGQGHVVVRVDPQGKTYRIYILDDTAENFKIKAVYGPYTSD